MEDQTKSFGDTAVSLARNPLGIIALFIVLVYGLASLVMLFAKDLQPADKTPLIYFQVIFPVLVLGVFYVLVSKHSEKLFGPSDYKDEANYVRMMEIVAKLSAASATSGSQTSDKDLKGIVKAVIATNARAVPSGDTTTRQILWVDDNPDNNTFVRQAFESAGLQVTTALSTDEAFQKMASTKFGAIISDMVRPEGKTAGYDLLDKMRQGGNNTPLYFYAGSNSAEHKIMTKERGGQGSTNSAKELFELVMNAVTGQPS